MAYFCATSSNGQDKLDGLIKHLILRITVHVFFVYADHLCLTFSIKRILIDALLNYNFF